MKRTECQGMMLPYWPAGKKFKGNYWRADTVTAPKSGPEVVFTFTPAPTDLTPLEMKAWLWHADKFGPGRYGTGRVSQCTAIDQKTVDTLRAKIAGTYRVPIRTTATERTPRDRAALVERWKERCERNAEAKIMRTRDDQQEILSYTTYAVELGGDDENGDYQTDTVRPAEGVNDTQSMDFDAAPVAPVAPPVKSPRVPQLPAMPGMAPLGISPAKFATARERFIAAQAARRAPVADMDAFIATMPALAPVTPAADRVKAHRRPFEGDTVEVPRVREPLSLPVESALVDSYSV